MYPGGDDKSVIAAIYTPIRATLPPPATRSLVYQDDAVFMHYIYTKYMCRMGGRRTLVEKKTFFLPFLNIMHIVHAYGCANSDENISFVTDIIREPKPVWILLLLLLYYGSAIVLECNICLQQQL